MKSSGGKNASRRPYAISGPHANVAEPGQKHLRRKLRSDVWPKVCYGLTTPRNGHPLATGDAIDDIATVAAQFADGYFAHASGVSHVRQRHRGGCAGKVPNWALDDTHNRTG